MLSPGEWYKLVPTDLDENLAFRLEVLRRCEVDSEFRQGIWEICKLDIVFFINVFIWQFNPKKKGDEAIYATAPFICWDCQIAILLDRPETTGELGILWCDENNKTVLVQKSREMGASWLFIILQVWFSIFHDSSQALNISRNEKMVDSASPDSLFWKIRYLHKWLPDWMTGEMVKQQMHFEYLRSGSFITGEPSTGAAGVGGRAGRAFIDEFSRIKEDTAVRQGTASTADVRYFNGTHEGTGTEMYRMSITPEIVQLILHWSDHPEKRAGAYRFNQATNEVEFLDPDYEYPPDYKFDTSGRPVGGPHPGLRSPWYDKKCIDIGSPAGVAQQLDINPAGSSGAAFDQVLVANLILQTSRPPVWTGDIIKGEDGEYKLVEDQGSPLLDDDAGPLRLWVLPDLYGRFPRAVYETGWDVSGGTGTTNSCGAIGNADTGEFIGEYANPNIYPDVLAPMAVWLARLLVDAEDRPAGMIWEKQGPGIRFGREVVEAGFSHYFTNDTTMGKFDGSIKAIPGWDAEIKAKNLMLNEFESGLRNREAVVRSELALKELLLFQWSTDGKKIYHTGSRNQNDPSGAGDNHGDRGIAYGLTWKRMKPYTTMVKKEAVENVIPEYSYEWRRLHKQGRRSPTGLSPIYDD